MVGSQWFVPVHFYSTMFGLHTIYWTRNSVVNSWCPQNKNEPKCLSICDQHSFISSYVKARLNTHTDKCLQCSSLPWYMWEASQQQNYLQVIVDCLIDQDKGQHGPTQAPLVAALLKQNNLKQSPQNLGEQARRSTNVLCYAGSTRYWRTGAFWLHVRENNAWSRKLLISRMQYTIEVHNITGTCSVTSVISWSLSKQTHKNMDATVREAQQINSLQLYAWSRSPPSCQLLMHTRMRLTDLGTWALAQGLSKGK